jgi:hypothetical protein|tara:strand:- start:15 stop:254 length:240 start_codon:yes stop_codon:yes gene_type:complete
MTEPDQTKESIMTKAKADLAQTDITNPDELIQKADKELESISTTINELATRQQRVIGYRQCLIDMKETNNATTKNPSTS